jgi:hypothetical protein
VSGPTVNLPVIGTVPRTAAIGGAALVAGIVGYAYFKRAQNAAAANAAAAAAPNSDYGDPDVLPVVPGGAPGGFGPVNGGSQTGSAPPANAILDNSQWTAAVRDRLAGTYPEAVLMDAIGAFLNKQPLTSEQQKIIRAAIAVAGYPPVGSLTIISGGADTPMLVAPSNVRQVNVRPDGYLIVWDSVPGAVRYKTYENGEHTADNPTTECDVHNREPLSSASFEFTAISASGQEGPRSAPKVFRTAAAPAAAPAPAPAAPAPWSPPPAPAAPAPAPVVHRFPEHWFTHTNVSGDNYSSIASRYGLGISGEELYQYQFSSQAGRPAGTQATLRQRGHTIFAGGSTEIPYPR